MIYSTRYDFLLNLLLCAADLGILAGLMTRMYGSIPPTRRVGSLSFSTKKAAICIAGAGLLLLAALFSVYSSTFLTLPVSFLILWCFPKNPRKKLLFESCLSVIVFSYILILNDITNVLPKNGAIWIMWYLIAYHAGLWLLLYLCLKLCRHSDENLPLSLWLLFLAIPAITLLCSIVSLLFLGNTGLSRPLSDLMHLFLQTAFLFINLVLFDLFRRFSLYYQRENEKSLLEQQLKIQSEHYQAMLETASQIKSIRHDMKNHLQTIALLYQTGSQEELLTYLQRTTALIQQTDQLISSGNPALDALLGMKVAEMRTKGIHCLPRLSIPQNLPLSFSDTVIILGNLLDNAIQSCQKWTGSKEIQIALSYRQHSLLIHMENPCVENQLAPWGTGLRNVQHTVEKYSGTLQASLQEHIYAVDLVLYNL